MAAIDLRPMSLGEVLDRTFSLYKSNFWLFVGIFALPYPLVAIAGLLYSSTLLPMFSASSVPLRPADASQLFATMFGTMALFFVALVAFAAAQAATVRAVSNLHLGQPASVARSYARIRGRILIVVATMILAVLLAAIPGFLAAVAVGLLAAFVATLIHSPASAFAGVLLVTLFAALVLPAAVLPTLVIYCRTALAVPAATLEPIGPAAAVRRSFSLTKGIMWGIFLVYLLVFVLAIVAALVFQVPFLLAGGSPFKPHALSFGMLALNGLAAWLSGVVVGPIATIAFSLIYYNQRVRKEAFDLEHLMTALGPSESTGAPSVA